MIERMTVLAYCGNCGAYRVLETLNRYKIRLGTECKASSCNVCGTVAVRIIALRDTEAADYCLLKWRIERLKLRVDD